MRAPHSRQRCNFICFVCWIQFLRRPARGWVLRSRSQAVAGGLHCEKGWQPPHTLGGVCLHITLLAHYIGATPPAAISWAGESSNCALWPLSHWLLLLRLLRTAEQALKKRTFRHLPGRLAH